MIIIKALEHPVLLIKIITETVDNDEKEQKGGLLGMIAAALEANLLGNMLAGKGVLRGDKGTIRPDEGEIRAAQYF